MFVRGSPAEIWVYVTAHELGDLGETTRRDFRAKFRRLLHSEKEALLARTRAETVGESALLSENLIGWAELEWPAVDADSAVRTEPTRVAMPFTPENVAIVLDDPDHRAALLAAFMGLLANVPSAREKN